MEQIQRMVWLDALRLCAGLSMVVLHATTDSNGQPFPDATTTERTFPLLVRAVAYTARTELFIVIALFLLFFSLERRPRNYRATVYEQSQRLVPPFLFWTVFYCAYNFVKATHFNYAEYHAAEIKNLATWSKYILLGDVKYHMHFIPTLFGIVLCYPAFKVAARYPVMGLFLFLGLAIKQQVDVFIWAEFWGEPQLPYLVRATKILAYIGYGFAAGALFAIWRDKRLDIAKWSIPLVWTGLGLFLIKLIATWHTIERGKWIYDDAASYWADFLMPVVLFALCLSLSARRWPQFFSKIAPFSFGIYLSHPIFLDLVEIGLHGRELDPTYQFAAKVSAAMVGTSVLVFILSKSSILSWTIGLGKFPLKISRSRRAQLRKLV